MKKIINIILIVSMGLLIFPIIKHIQYAQVYVGVDVSLWENNVVLENFLILLFECLVFVALIALLVIFNLKHFKADEKGND